MTESDLLEIADAKGHEVIDFPLKRTTGLAVSINGKCFIGLSERIYGIERKEVLAHELGHCEYGGFYDKNTTRESRRKTEQRAKKWAYMKLLPIGEIREAFQNGICEVWEIADMFSVSYEYASEAVTYYSSIGLI